ncbi:MAG: hypothetical protein V5A77_07605 [Candidatus Bipolaricaulota bacterium]|nr:helix-turn-helix domain-containing protein [Candidatus Bipolaricaulota bacterium]
MIWRKEASCSSLTVLPHNPNQRSTIINELHAAYSGTTIHHLCPKERGKTQTEIAETIRIHKSTVSREFKRNTGGRGYRYKQANRFATKRRKDQAAKRITEEDWEKSRS